MAPHSSTLAWKIPWTEEPGRLQSMGSLRVRHDWVTSLSLFTFMHWRRKWQPAPVFLPGESQGRGAWWAAVYGVAQSRTWLKRLSSSSSNQNHYNLWFLFLLKYLQHSTTWWPDSILSVTDVCPHMSLCPVQGVGRQVMRPRLSQHLLGFRRFSFLGSVLLPA